jgi:hypothetical protein
MNTQNNAKSVPKDPDGGAGGVSVVIASFCVFMGILASVALPG